MANLVFLFLVILWLAGSAAVYYCGLKTAIRGIAAVVYAVFTTGYFVWLFSTLRNNSLEQNSIWLLLTCLLVATMICFYLILLSFIMSGLIQSVRSNGFGGEPRKTGV